MKTTCPSESSPCLSIRKFLPWVGLVRSIRRILPVLAGIALVQLSLIPHANAAGPDGQYRYSSASGSLMIGDDAFNLSDGSMTFGTLSNGKARIRKSKLKLYRKETSEMINAILPSYLDSVKIAGPSSVRLKKSGSIYKGSSRPLVVSFSGNIDGYELSGRIQWTYKVVVKGRKLIVTAAPISGSLAVGTSISTPMSGNISITCNK